MGGWERMVMKRRKVLSALESASNGEKCPVIFPACVIIVVVVDIIFVIIVVVVVVQNRNVDDIHLFEVLTCQDGVP